ncbi:uncharacterized protein K452DRAFT_357410 [Aplosporella prunicola CBS 121167]|uniref:Uncharacterized protein n=1 Tax=Aplosporella prunicola CBS 121167 TaxID=1176127 RepID=A0A6A6BLT0_9PEZI|nr:uncharacterized protein K452DRAFT_357410 [Aplosporella prunicola CBS 121167]KAF2143797.1 hypothetical protein K452DRAFT_357410 [Aplosporella prunicola CBS 121167]
MRLFERNGFWVWAGCVVGVVRARSDGFSNGTLPSSSNGFVTSSRLPQNASTTATDGSSWASVLSCYETWTSYLDASYSYEHNKDLWKTSYQVTTGITTTTSTETITLNFTGPYITLCDGIPRGGKRETVYSTHSGTSSFSRTRTSTVQPTYTKDPPSCSFRREDCSSLDDVNESWLSTATKIAANHMPPMCSSLTYTSCQPCSLYGADLVQLYYWPVTGDAQTLCPNGTTAHKANAMITAQPRARAAEPVTTTIGSLTFVSPSVYLYFTGLNALGLSGEHCGTVAPNRTALLALPPSDLSTQHGYKGAAGPTSFNLDNLAYTTVGDFAYPLVPSSAYWYPNSCCGDSPQGTDCPFAVSTCASSTIYDNYRPKIAFPSQITDIEPSWATCTPFWDFEGSIDPPIALKPANGLFGTTTRGKQGQAVETTPASPSSPLDPPFASKTAAPAVPVSDPLTRTGMATATALPPPSATSDPPIADPTTAAPGSDAEDPGEGQPAVPQTTEAATATATATAAPADPGTGAFQLDPTGGASSPDAAVGEHTQPATAPSSAEDSAGTAPQAADPPNTAKDEDPAAVIGDARTGIAPTATAVEQLPGAAPATDKDTNTDSATTALPLPTNNPAPAPNPPSATAITTIAIAGQGQSQARTFTLAPAGAGIIVSGSTRAYSALDAPPAPAPAVSVPVSAAHAATAIVAAPAPDPADAKANANANAPAADGAGAPAALILPPAATLSPGGAAATVAGRIVSLREEGVVLDGAVVPFSAVASAADAPMAKADATADASADAAAVPGVPAAEAGAGSAVVLTLDASHTLTAHAGAPLTLAAGAQPATLVGGQAGGLGAAGVVVNGVTRAFAGSGTAAGGGAAAGTAAPAVAPAVAPAAGTAPAPEGVVLTLDGLGVVTVTKPTDADADATAAAASASAAASVVLTAPGGTRITAFERVAGGSAGATGGAGAAVLADGRALVVGGEAMTLAGAGAGAGAGDRDGNGDRDGEVAVAVSAVEGGVVVLEGGRVVETGLFAAAVGTGGSGTAAASVAAGSSAAAGVDAAKATSDGDVSVAVAAAATTATTTGSVALSRTAGTAEADDEGRSTTGALGSASASASATTSTSAKSSEGSAKESTQTGAAGVGRRREGTGLVLMLVLVVLV